jgi:hypothetical protein
LETIDASVADACDHLAFTIKNSEAHSLACRDDIVPLRCEVMSMDFACNDVDVVQSAAIPQWAFAKGGPGQLVYDMKSETNAHDIAFFIVSAGQQGANRPTTSFSAASIEGHIITRK